MASVPIGDRRRSQRRWAAVAVAIVHRGSRIDAVSINIGHGGMYLFSAADLPLGSEIEMEFCPPESKRTISISGVVRRRALYLYGIEFLADVATAARDGVDVGSEDRTPLA